MLAEAVTNLADDFTAEWHWCLLPSLTILFHRINTVIVVLTIAEANRCKNFVCRGVLVSNSLTVTLVVLARVVN